jgi:molecular chaperone IbpA
VPGRAISTVAAYFRLTKHLTEIRSGARCLRISAPWRACGDKLTAERAALTARHSAANFSSRASSVSVCLVRLRLVMTNPPERLAEDRYQITLAVAGFSPGEVSITAEQNVATIEGGKTEKTEREFLYRGISTRHFKRQFSLADYVQVKGAAFDNGLLKIELVREIPEAMKPRRIAIASATSSSTVHQIEAQAA